MPESEGLTTYASRSLRYFVTNVSASSTMTSRRREKNGSVHTSSRTVASGVTGPANRLMPASRSSSGKNRPGDRSDRLADQVRIVAEDGVNRPDRLLARLTQPVECVHPSLLRQRVRTQNPSKPPFES